MTEEKKLNVTTRQDDVSVSSAKALADRLQQRSRLGELPVQTLMDRIDTFQTLRMPHSALAVFEQQRERLASAQSLLASPMEDELRRSAYSAVAVDPFASSAKSIADAVAEIQLLSVHQEEAIRLSHGPVAEIDRLLAFESLGALSSESERMQSIADRAAESFRMPAIEESSSILADMVARNDQAIAGLSSYQTSIQSAMDAIEQPWIRHQNAVDSIAAYSQLHTMAAELAQLDPFSDSLVHRLRVGLGDWRTSMEVPVGVADSLILRSELYADRGFDPDLTDFPNEVFEEALEDGKLRQPVPSVGEWAETPIPAPEGNCEEGLERTRWARERIVSLEMHVRVFIAAQLEQVAGTKWLKQRVPGNMRRRWIEKRDTAVEAGAEPQGLIAYADFTDYTALIQRTDNWNDAFKPYFRRREDITESWQRLFPVRIATAHSRVISQDDELLVAFETKRILKAMGALS